MMTVKAEERLGTRASHSKQFHRNRGWASPWPEVNLQWHAAACTQPPCEQAHLLHLRLGSLEWYSNMEPKKIRTHFCTVTHRETFKPHRRSRSIIYPLPKVYEAPQIHPEWKYQNRQYSHIRGNRDEPAPVTVWHHKITFWVFPSATKRRRHKSRRSKTRCVSTRCPRWDSHPCDNPAASFQPAQGDTLAT